MRQKLRAFQEQIRDEVKWELRNEMEDTIRENVKLELTPIITKQLRRSLCSEAQFAELFSLVCKANGTSENGFSMDAFVEECGGLANDVFQVRKALSIPEGPFLRFFSELQIENSHLDQLHTQTRSLLVRQAQMIAELRELAHTSSWTAWAKRIYWLINRENIASDDVAEVKEAVEASITRLL
jgi:hypothetical protein